MTGLEVWVNGRLTPASAATVSVYDRGFRSGEGVFETLRVYGGYPFRLDEHLARAVRGATELGIEVDGATLADAVRATVATNRSRFAAGDCVIRVTISSGDIDPDSPFPGTSGGAPRIVVTPHHLPRPHTALTTVSLPWVRELAHLKSTAYLLSVVAEQEARRRGADTALLSDPAGMVAEAATANVFAVFDGCLVTPPAEGPLLAGITRRIVIGLARARGIEVREERFAVADLRRASEALATSSVREVVGLTAIDGASIGDGTIGRVTTRLRSVYSDLVMEERRNATSG